MTNPTPTPIPYDKPWLDYAAQVARLQGYGLVIPDTVAAENVLAHIGYYRFSGYCLAFETQRHVFQAGTTFDHVRSAYDFDWTLRDLVTEALEVVEVDFRTAVAHHLGREFGAFGHTDAASFHGTFFHAEWLEQLSKETERSNEPFVNHFRDRYAEYPNLPIWVAAEVMSFGALSRMYQGMWKDDQKTIAYRYGIQAVDLATIIHHLVYVRNLCAHHARLWDRTWAIKPSLPHAQHWHVPHLLSPPNARLYATLLVLYRLLCRCRAAGTFPAEWKARVWHLLATPPQTVAPLATMGMPVNWAENPLWV